MRNPGGVRSATIRAYGSLLHAATSHTRILRFVPGTHAVHRVILRRIEAPRVVTATVSDLRLLVHAEGTVGRNLLLYGSYEPYETQLVQSSIIPGSTVLDIGANVGYYSLLASRTVGGQGRVLSFEPHPELFGLLSHNRTVNGAQNVVPFNVALSDRAGTAQLFVSPIDHGKHSLSSVNAASGAGIPPSPLAAVPPADPGGVLASMLVPMMRLDDVLRGSDLPPVSVVKIDVEGAEALVLDGAADLLATARPLTIFFEFWADGITRLDRDPQSLLARLVEAGFVLSVIDGRQQKLIPSAPDEILARCQGSAARQLDLHCVRS